jgi:hypothetical protein
VVEVIVERHSLGRYDVLHIASLRLFWDLDLTRLDELLGAREAGLRVMKRSLALGIRRARLPHLYRRRVAVTVRASPSRTRLALTPIGKPEPSSLDGHRTAERSTAKHAPGLCESCGAPLPRSRGCTVCPRSGFAV